MTTDEAYKEAKMYCAAVAEEEDVEYDGCDVERVAEMLEDCTEGVPEGLRPKCQMTGEDGNVFAVISRVSRALKNVGLQAKATEFTRKAMSSEFGNYDGVLAAMFNYVDVQ